MSLSDLDPDLVECLVNGDGLYSHYSKRSPFLFLDTKGSHVLILARGQNDEVTAVDALNCTGGYATGILGGRVGDLKDVMIEALDEATATNDEHHALERLHLSRKVKQLIADHTRTHPEQWAVSFTSTGTEAMDLAVQLVLQEGYDAQSGEPTERTGRDVIVACFGAWHGWGMAPNQLLNRKQYTGGVPRIAGNEIVFMGYGSENELQRIFSTYRGRIRAVFVEGILGDGGIMPASESWWRRLTHMAEEEGARIVDDEILTCLRTGGALALPRGVAPHCLTLGKGLGFGLFPISAVIWRQDLIHLRRNLGLRTFNARPFMARVTLAGLQYIEDNGLFEKSREIGRRLVDGLGGLIKSHSQMIKAVRGQGCMVGVELHKPYAGKTRLLRDCLILEGLVSEAESGTLGDRVPAECRVNQTMRMTPPMTLSDEDLNEVIHRFDRGCARFLTELE
ncbi:MAG: aminotransferase class III-fold pyridoxal phosphate-dependent enzyme [Acidobacteriota bacterium]|nr:aminotransferase class III-fold pyridoxal phosphate-dependent enzyme [Acidobacteriota bacterium]